MYNESIRRDAKFLAAYERPFTRWSELTGKEQEKYENTVIRLRKHLKDYENTTIVP